MAKSKVPLFHEKPVGHEGDEVEYVASDPLEAKDLFEMTADELIEVATLDFLKPDLHGQVDKRRDEFYDRFKWPPRSEMEVSAGLAGLPTYIAAVYRDSGLKAAKKVKSAVDRWRGESVVAIEEIKRMQNPDTEEFVPEWVRSGTVARQELAKIILARNSLNVFQWPRHYDKKTKEIVENEDTARLLLWITDRLASQEDGVIIALCEKGVGWERARLRFWAEQVDFAKNSDKSSDSYSAVSSNV